MSSTTAATGCGARCLLTQSLFTHPCRPSSVYSLMTAQRRLHKICELALYDTAMFSVSIRVPTWNVPRAEPLLVKPRKLLDCISLSPSRINLVSRIPSVRIRFIGRPEGYILNYTRTQKEMERVEAMLGYLAPTSVSFYTLYEIRRASATSFCALPGQARLQQAAGSTDV